MSHSPTQQDQRTIKRCYSNFQHPKHHSKNYSTLPQSTHYIKKPLNQLFSHHFLNDQHPLTHSEISQNLANLQTPPQPQKSFNLNDLTTKFEEKPSQPNQNYSNCCARLFTFMESTQKEKLTDQNKENQFHQNILAPNSKQRHFLKPNASDLPLKLTPKPQGSTKFLKKINYHPKNRQKLAEEFVNIPKAKQNELLTFIQGSRKKREQLLIQLEKLDFNCLESLCPDNIKYLTPQQRLSKKSTPKIRIESSRNSLNGSKSNKNFFRKKSITNEKKSPRVIMKQNLRQRHFSSNSIKNMKQTVSPKNVLNSQRNRANSEFQNLKRQHKLLKQQGSQSKKSIVERKKSQINFIKQDSSGAISRKFKQKQQISQNKRQLSRNSISKNQKQTKMLNIEFQDEKNKKAMEELMKRKKQLEKELINLNDDIVLFNRKKKKPVKGPK